jgi:hypothetical protein
MKNSNLRPKCFSCEKPITLQEYISFLGECPKCYTAIEAPKGWEPLSENEKSLLWGIAIISGGLCIGAFLGAF